MRISVSSLQEILTKSMQPMVRFSVTVLNDAKEPLWTSQGWRFTLEKQVLPPSTGFAMYNQISPEFGDMLAAALMTFPGVRQMFAGREEMPVSNREDFKGQAEVG